MKPILNTEHIFEVLCGDCMSLEPFPEEIKVIGRATGWYERIQAFAKNRGIEIKIEVILLADKSGD